MERLKDKVVIVTGAAQGMGEHSAALFAAEGAQVIVADVNESLGQSVAARIGENAQFRPLDVSDAESWKSLIAFVIKRFNRVDGLVNNAAIQFTALIEDTDIAAARKLFEVDLMGPWLGMKSVVPHMKAARRGSIVNISSNLGLTGHSGSTVYSGAKWGLRGVSKSLAKEVGPFGVRVNCVLPGTVDTPMLRRGVAEMTNAAYETAFPEVALNRIAEPTEIAAASLFLLSDDSSYVSGTDLTVDGGWTCGCYTANKPQAA